MKAFGRAALTVLLLGSIPLYVLSYILIPKTGYFGIATDYSVANAPSITLHVVASTPGSPAWRGGIRAGDAMPLATVNRFSRVALGFPLPGARTRYAFVRASGTGHADAILASAPPKKFEAPDAIRAFVVFCLLVFGLLVVLRGWNTENGPLVATILTAIVLNSAISSMPWVANSGFAAGVLIANYLLVVICGVVFMVLPVAIAGRLGEWRSRALRIAAYVLAGLYAFNLVYEPISLILQLSGRAGAFTEFANDWLIYTFPEAIAALALVLAYTSAQKENRQPLSWIFWGFFPCYVGITMLNAVQYVPSSAAFLLAEPQIQQLAYGLFRVMELALPVALFYGLLVRRTVDIGFVFNRVAVYALLSLALFLIFELFEYGISHFFLDTGRVGSLSVQVVVALLIGLSARYLHRFAEHFVDHVLFAKRHADEKALRRFALEAEKYTSADVMLDRALETIFAYSDARGVAIYLSRGDRAESVRATDSGFPVSVDLDDPLLVSIRSSNQPIDTRSSKTALPDGMVFPMIRRGQLVGVIACEPKRDASAFDPDERESLSAIARAIAPALEFEHAADERELLLKAIEKLGEQIREIRAELQVISNRRKRLRA